MKFPISHGGRRPGAGRKPTNRQAYTLRMSPAARAGLESAARAVGISLPDYLDRTYAGRDKRDPAR